ncbi:hypothetical protein C0U44_31265, partial [Klebsiella pneumoniae]
MINGAPKYGNDDDSVDELLARAYQTYIDELAEDFDRTDPRSSCARRLINGAPKYGNDDDSVDELLARAYQTYIDEL